MLKNEGSLHLVLKKLWEPEKNGDRNSQKQRSKGSTFRKRPSFLWWCRSLSRGSTDGPAGWRGPQQGQQWCKCSPASDGKVFSLCFSGKLPVMRTSQLYSTQPHRKYFFFQINAFYPYLFTCFCSHTQNKMSSRWFTFRGLALDYGAKGIHKDQVDRK